MNDSRIGWCFAAVLLGSVWNSGADVIAGFQGAFAPGQWSTSSDQGGSVVFNSTTPPSTLTFTGPTGNLSPSYETASITPTMSPSPNGEWQLNFEWSFNSGSAESATEELDYTGLASPVVLASGGPGTTESGSYSFELPAGATLSFVLIEDDTSAGKTPGSFEIEDFDAIVPEQNAALWMTALLLGPIVGRHYWMTYRRRTTAHSARL